MSSSAKAQTEPDSALLASPWDWWRSQMPVAKKWAYLDHAAVGPLSGGAAEAIRRYATQAETEGDTVWPQWARTVETLRERLATLLRAETDEIALVPNTSSGISLVAEGFPFQPGDNVVVPDHEFPSNLYPWQNQQARGVELRVAPLDGDRVCVDELFRQVDDRTRIISVSWVGYASGFRSDIAEIVDRAHQRGVLVFVDAIQGLGIFDLDVQATPVDFLAADGHKWLLGPEGMGAAFIRRSHLDTLRCGAVGWNSVKNPFNYTEPRLEFRASASRFEPGSANMVGAAGLAASLDLFLRVRDCHGSDAIGDRVLAMAGELRDRLKEVGCETRAAESVDERSGIVNFSVPGCEPAKVRSAAMDRGCVVSCRGGGVRASVHAYNDSSDIDRLVEAVTFSRSA